MIKKQEKPERLKMAIKKMSNSEKSTFLVILALLVNISGFQPFDVLS